MKTLSFKQLHSKNTFFTLGNCWDALSARVFEQTGYKAVGTSSWALSSINGVKDGENIKFKTVFDNAKCILKQIKIPLSIDIEKGYSQETGKIIDNVIKLADIGCAGINIEDSTKNGLLLPSVQFAKTISLIKKKLLAEGFFDFIINARTDTYLIPSNKNIITETVTRSFVYQDAGADCLFVPGLKDLNDIREISDKIKLPLNVLNLPGIANVKELQTAGVNRFSLGNSVFDDVLSYIEKTIKNSFYNGEYSNHYDHSPLNLTFN